MVGVGIDVYDALPDLTWAVDDVAAIARRLREGGFSVVRPASGRRSAIVDVLDDLAASDGLVVLWAGHGERSERGTLRLFAAENAASDGDMKLITVDELAECVAARGRAPVAADPRHVLLRRRGAWTRPASSPRCAGGSRPATGAGSAC